MNEDKQTLSDYFLDKFYKYEEDDENFEYDEDDEYEESYIREMVDKWAEIFMQKDNADLELYLSIKFYDELELSEETFFGDPDEEYDIEKSFSLRSELLHMMPSLINKSNIDNKSKMVERLESITPELLNLEFEKNLDNAFFVASLGITDNVEGSIYLDIVNETMKRTEAAEDPMDVILEYPGTLESIVFQNIKFNIDKDIE